MKKLTRSIFLGLALLLLPGLAWAQQGTVTGTITDAEAEEPLPGATVQILDTGAGAAADEEGQYRFTEVPAGENTIRVSFVGYEAEERTINVPAGGTARVNFQLQPSTAALEEVTVSAYRPETDQVGAGSATGISTGEVEASDAQSVEGALQGQAAGVRVQSTSGQPGAGFNVNVRGAISINAGSDPLYIVDGVQINKEDNLNFGRGNPLSSLNPNDIESIQVLKDAAAAAIYGAQAANGVVVIETKSGTAGETRINFSTEIGYREEIVEPDPMTTEQYFNFQDEALNNAIRAKTPFESLSDATGGNLTARGFNTSAYGTDTLNTDWKDALFRQGVTQSYNASLSGGNEDTQFRISGRFARTEAQSLSSNFRQGQLRAKVTNSATDFLDLTANANLSTQVFRGVNEGVANVNSPFFAVYQIRPNQPVYSEPGNPSSGFNFGVGSQFFGNPVAQQKLNTRQSNVNSFNTNVEADWDLPGSFAARTFAGTQYDDVEEEFFGDPRLFLEASSGGTGFYDTERAISFNVSQSLSYNNVFADVHQVSALGGAELKRVKEINSRARGIQFPNELFRTLQSAAEPTDVFAGETQYRQQSLFGNASYTYDNTYQIQGTLRYDGNSRFGSENRYGTFWTAAAYWRISNESFLEDVGFLSNLKLRASYGITGNSDGIGDFQSLQQYGSGPAYAGQPGIRANNIGNAQLTWEEKVSTNIGLDYGFFGGRIQGSVDAFRDDRESLLINRDLPVSSGFGSILSNVGTIRVQGVDIALQTTNIDDWNGVTWTTNFNISFQEAEVEKLLPNDDLITTAVQYQVGSAPAQRTLVPYAGVNPANGVPMYKDKNGDLTYVPNDPVNEREVGNASPDFFGGFGNTISFRGLSVSAFFQYDYGRRSFNNQNFFYQIGVPFITNKSQKLLNRWKEPGDVTEVPKAYGTVFGFALPFSGLQTYENGFAEQGGFGSTRFLENASYIRLKQVEVQYDLPSSLLEDLPQVRSLSVFARGSNLITWTDFNGVEVESVGSLSASTFPQARTFTFGLDLGL